MVSVPLVWFPRLAAASTRERSEGGLIGGGIGIHWEAIDEDISVASLLRPENFMRLPDKALPPAARKKRAAAEEGPVQPRLVQLHYVKDELIPVEAA